MLSYYLNKPAIFLPMLRTRRLINAEEQDSCSIGKSIIILSVNKDAVLKNAKMSC